MLKVCIDAGHGGKDPGAVNGSFYEKAVVLDVALRAEKLLKASGYKVVMTRGEDVYNTPTEKARIANESGADIFISIHCNSSASSEANGTETLVYNEGERLGRTLQINAVEKLMRTDRGVKVRKDLMVLNSTKMPAALLELAFISNEEEKALLEDDEFRQRAAEAVALSVMEYDMEVNGMNNENEEMSLKEVKEAVKEKFGFDENTMLYLEMYRYGEALMRRLMEK